MVAMSYVTPKPNRQEARLLSVNIVFPHLKPNNTGVRIFQVCSHQTFLWVGYLDTVLFL